MKSKPNPILIGLLLIVIVSIIWWFSNRDQTNDLDNASAASTISESNNTSIENSTDKDEESAHPMPTFVDTTDRQKEFSKRVENLVKATTNCQKDVESLFPVDSLEGPSKTYTNLSKFKDAIQKFYQVVGKRVEKSQELMNFLETLPENEIPADRLFTQLSSIEDCGEFEEEAILDQALTTAQELKWPQEQKRELTNTIMNLFEQQLNGNLGLHQISSKIEVLHSLADEGFISSKCNQELTALDQVMDNAESDFRQSLPADFAQKKVPSQKDIVEIKNLERDIIEKVKPQIVDFMSGCRNN